MTHLKQPGSTLSALRRPMRSETLAMTVQQAKEFLVQESIDQAAREGVSLSDFEKSMMYFTESDTSSKNSIDVNEEFETHYPPTITAHPIPGTADYEIKISRLLHHAFERIKREDPPRMFQWNLAIRTLRSADHFLLVLWDAKLPGEHLVRDFLKLLTIGILAAFGIFLAEILR
jgi:hypothetical protein